MIMQRQHKIQCCTACKCKVQKKVGNCSKDDMPFFYISILWPAGFLTISSVFFLGIAFIYLNNNDFNTGWKSDGINYFHSFGKKYFTCIDNMPYEDGMWPSFLRQTQLSYWANIYFRISIMAPMPLRIFFAIIIRSYKKAENPHINCASLYNFINDLIPLMSIIEVFSQTLFSVLTIRFDSATFYQYAFKIFVLSSSFYMFLLTISMAVSIKRNQKYIEIISIIVKLIAIVTYFYCSLTVFSTHLKFVNNIQCHAYVNKNEAIHEYLLIASYLLFHLTLLIDIRKVKFLCYPPSSNQCFGKNEIDLVKETLN